MTTAALPLLILELTSESQQEHVLGLVAAAAALPALLFALPSGMSADRHDRRQLLIGSELVSGVAMALVVVLVVADRLTIVLVVVLAFVMGSASVLFTAAVHPTVPTIVPDELLEDANGKLAAAADGTEFVGTPLGPLLFALAPWAPFLLDAVTYGASAALLRAVPPQPRASVARRAEMRLDSAIDHLRRSRPLVAIWFALGALSLTGALVFTLLPVVLRDRVGVSVAGYGPLLTLVAFGSTAAGLCAKWIIAALGQRVALAVGVIGNAIAYIVFGTTDRWWVAGAALAAWGFSVTLGGVVTMTIRQRLIPGAMMGRVLALFQLVIAVGTVAGSLLAAVIGDAVGVGTVIVVAGVAQFAVLALVMAGLAGVDAGAPPVVEPEP
jgi:predicted MFS family arabinose efflux permease